MRASRPHRGADRCRPRRRRVRPRALPHRGAHGGDAQGGTGRAAPSTGRASRGSRRSCRTRSGSRRRPSSATSPPGWPRPASPTPRSRSCAGGNWLRLYRQTIDVDLQGGRVAVADRLDARGPGGETPGPADRPLHLPAATRALPRPWPPACAPNPHRGGPGPSGPGSPAARRTASCATVGLRGHRRAGRARRAGPRRAGGGPPPPSGRPGRTGRPGATPGGAAASVSRDGGTPGRSARPGGAGSGGSTCPAAYASAASTPSGRAAASSAGAEPRAWRASSTALSARPRISNRTKGSWSSSLATW
ncbi:hypothetical protein SVIOM342S_08801 [Streptomyces violaceorubidus]